MAIALTVFGTAFLAVATLGFVRLLPLTEVHAGAAVFAGLVLLALGALLARIGKGQ